MPRAGIVHRCHICRRELALDPGTHKMILAPHREARPPSDDHVPPLDEFAWRRHHGPDIIAEVIVNARGCWLATAWYRTAPTVIRRAGRPRASRNSACAKADALARQTFAHSCEPGLCGVWFPFRP